MKIEVAALNLKHNAAIKVKKRWEERIMLLTGAIIIIYK